MNSNQLKEMGFFSVKCQWNGEGVHFPTEYYTTDGIRFFQKRKNEYGRFYYLGDAVVMDEVPAPIHPWEKF